jgi:cytochrome c oxidase assembly factor CtaG
MSPVLIGWLLDWEWRPEVILALGSLGAVYGLGWWRLRRRGHRRLANGWRLAAYLGGLGALALALLSAVDTLQEQLFAMHMVQHKLLTMAAPPLLLLGNPLPFFLWGMPAGFRRAVGRPLARETLFRRGLRRLTAPWAAWALFVVTLWLWHMPAAYDAALRYEFLHDVEHFAFFWTSLLFWWHVTGAAPRVHGSFGYGLRITYVLAALAQNEILGMSIAFAREPLYPYYATAPRLWGLSALDDQKLGGTIMWVVGGEMYVDTVIVLLARLLRQEEKRAVRAAAHSLFNPEGFQA